MRGFYKEIEQTSLIQIFSQNGRMVPLNFFETTRQQKIKVCQKTNTLIEQRQVRMDPSKRKFEQYMDRDLYCSTRANQMYEAMFPQKYIDEYSQRIDKCYKANEGFIDIFKKKKCYDQAREFSVEVYKKLYQENKKKLQQNS